MIKIKTAVVLVLAAIVSGPAMAQQASATLDKIKQTGVVTIGYREASIPFSYLDNNQKSVGFAMDICAKVVEAIQKQPGMEKVKVNFTPVTSATRIPLIANGTVDLECGSTTNNVERQKQVAFTNTHYLTASRFVSKKDAKLNTIADLAGKQVVSTGGTTNIGQLTAVNAEKNLGIRIMSAKDHAEAFLLVETGRAAAFVMDDILLSSLIAGSKSPGDYVISEDAFSLPEPYGIMLRRDDPGFKAVVDKATADLYKSPEMATLYAKWFTSPIPPRNLNLNIPLSPAMDKMFKQPNDSGDPSTY